MRKGKWSRAAEFLQIINEENKEAAEDLRALLSAIPNGIMKQLLRDDKRAAILAKYGVKGDE